MPVRLYKLGFQIYDFLSVFLRLRSLIFSLRSNILARDTPVTPGCVSMVTVRAPGCVESGLNCRVECCALSNFKFPGIRNAIYNLRTLPKLFGHILCSPFARGGGQPYGKTLN